jgi:ABC-type transport system involved in multi-copper enzyme maturation permease subunit
MIGPIFQRELSTLPRRPRHFIARIVFLVMLFAIICTTWLLLAGVQPVQNAGDLARFGVLIFQLLAPFQMVVLLFMAALAGTSAVSHEKDKQTLTLLLMTSLTDVEVVVGKIGAGLLATMNAFLSSAPIVFLLPILGGVSLDQVIACTVVTACTLIASCSLGATVAFWREKTFQAIAVTTLLIALWLALGEIIAAGIIPGVPRSIGSIISPLRAVWDIAQPIPSTSVISGLGGSGNAILASIFMSALAGLLSLLSIAKLRVWNPSRERRNVVAEWEDSPQMAVSPSKNSTSADTSAAIAPKAEQERVVKSWKSREPRAMWNNPILWREMMTWAYGRKILFIRVAYIFFSLLIGFGLYQTLQSGAAYADSGFQEQLVPTTVSLLAPCFVLSLIMINALAVNSITNERDAGALDLLLVTEITPGSFLFGKILGVLYATKEMVLMPILLCIYLWWGGGLTTENLVFTVICLMVMDIFVAMLGIHCGMIYYQSRVAIGTSLGTVFFLFLGVATCMLIMLMFRGSFGRQLAPFLMIILGGGTGLYVALGNRNPSPAITVTSFLLPFLTFFAITSFILRDQELTVFSTITVSYAFATAAMLIPALSEFEFAFGRGRIADEE